MQAAESDTFRARPRNQNFLWDEDDEFCTL